MSRNILVSSALGRLDRQNLRRFEEAGFETIRRYDVSGTEDETLLLSALKGAWGTVAGTERYTRRVFEGSPDLRVIARCGVGWDSIDVDAASDHGVAVVTTPSTNDEAVADFTLALMLAGLRQLRESDSRMRGGRTLTVPRARELSGKVVGIVGLGAIGQAVARRLEGFGCILLGTDPFAVDLPKELNVSLVDLEDALPRLDVLTIHAPLLDSTRGLIGDREVALLRRDCVVINTSRGGVMDDAALLAAISEGRLLSAGLDVFSEEPLGRNSPFLTARGVYLAGHVAALTVGSVEKTLDAALAALIAVRSGLAPDNCLNFAELGKAATSEIVAPLPRPATKLGGG